MSDDRVNQVKQANDIVEVVGGYLALRAAGQTFKALCPFHDDHRPSFDVDPRRQRYRCWSCGKYGDVISFVQEFEKVSFREALELLARRAGLEIESPTMSEAARSRVALLEVMRWADHQFHQCLLDSPHAQEARLYVAQRGLKGETVRRYHLGYAPRSWDWLVRQASAAGVSLELLEQVGLIGRRGVRAENSEDQGEAEKVDEASFYDRFRDRLQFPIRDVRGQTVGFGGRILPTSPLSSTGPKYYNSCDTPLFSKSEHLYGLDQARTTAERAGYLAVVEGYTDVLMAHQHGILQVVATMGTALNDRHVRQLRRYAPRVVLVFDADAGGATGVDRALELFASHDVELSIAALPSGLDPCDLLMQEQGADSFRFVLESAVDALEFKLEQALAREGSNGVEARLRVVDAVLGVIALAPPIAGQAKAAVKTQLMINRVARRLALKEEIVWARLDELRRQSSRRHSHAEPQHRGANAGGWVASRATPPGWDEGASASERVPVRQSAPAPLQERELLAALLADPESVPLALAEVPPEEITHPGLRKLYEGLRELLTAGQPPTLDLLRVALDHPRLAEAAMQLQEMGKANANRPTWLRGLLDYFRDKRQRRPRQDIHNQLQAPASDAEALELLRQFQNKKVEQGPDTATQGGWGGTPPVPPDTGVRS